LRLAIREAQFAYPRANSPPYCRLELDRVPVTNADFARFIAAHPQWRRDRVASLFAEGEYLSHWQSAIAPGPAILKKPVTQVSWFAANAYCEARGARLPLWYEWEYVAAADETRADARSDDAWRQRILQWYSQKGDATLADVGAERPNFYGVSNMHGLIWEWVDDQAGMLVSGDSRQQGEAASMRFCGSGAITMEQKENYATLMRIAMLSSVQANYTTATMGFRCARDL
jgi:sulfatase modifying factor 1